MQLSYFNGFHCCHICIGKEVLCEINGMLEGHIYMMYNNNRTNSYLKF